MRRYWGAACASNPEDDGQRITTLLQHGAHAFLGQEDAKAQEGDKFAQEVCQPPVCLGGFKEEGRAD